MELLEIKANRSSDWLRLREKLFPDIDRDYHRKEMRLISSSPDATCFLYVTDQGKAVGFLEVTLRNFVDGCLGGPVGYLEALYLEPEYRRRGEGRYLVDRVADWFRTKGCREMAADTDLDNEAAQKFFAHIGFTETFRIVQFKRTLNGVDAGRTTDEDEDIG